MQILSLLFLLVPSVDGFGSSSRNRSAGSFITMKVKKNAATEHSSLYLPKNSNQQLYVDKLSDPKTELVIGVGPAGTGKTLFPCQEAVSQMINFDKKIVLTRPLVSVNEDIGFLPGNINSKMDPWVRPLLDILEEYYSPPQVEDLLSYKKVEIVPLGFMRGRTFKNSFIIGDEMQNTTPEQLFMLLTRIGDGSKMVLTGDLAQSDVCDSGLKDAFNKLTSYYNDDEDLMSADGISVVKFDIDDILRHKLVSKIVDVYNN
tara:strand:- start:3823 stop:4599 length:777 start_codon:yes stop_codon:yes gene_type:complete